MAAGSVVIDLIMKTGGFETDSKRAEQRMRALEKEAKRVGAAIGAAFVAGATLVVTALKQSIDHMDELSKAAQRAQMPTEQFSQLAYAGSLADVAVEDLTKSMGKLAKAQGDAARGLTEQVDGFKALGIEFKNADGSLRPTYEVFLDFADAFQKHRGSPEIMALGMQVFGRSFQNLIPLLKDGRAGLEAMADESDRLGQTITTEAGQAAEAFNDNLTRLKGAATGLANAVASDLLPDLEALTDEWADSAKSGDGFSETAKDIADVIRTVGGAVKLAVWLFTTLTEKLDDAIQGFYGLAEAAKGVANLNWDQVTRGLGLAAQGATSSVLGRPEGPKNRNTTNFTIIRQSTDPRFSNVNTPGAPVDPLVIDPPSKSGGKGGKSEAEKAAESLERAYQSMNDQLDQQIALHGEVSEAARVRYELEHGSLTALDAAKAAQLIQDAEHLDMLDLIAEHEQIVADAARDVAEEQARRQEQAQDVLSAIQEETQLVQMSADAQEVWNNLKWAGVDAESEFGKAIIESTQDLQRQRDIMDDQIDAMDGLRGAFRGFFGDLREGEGIMGALENAADRFLDVLMDIAAQQLSDSLLGKDGDPGGGSWGDAIGSFIGAVFGGARATGGDAMPRHAYLIGEQGPELFIPRTAGTVLSNGQTQRAMAGGRGQSNNVSVVVQGQVDYRSRQQIARETERALRESQRNN
ncbi:hypothetical protein [Marilutibacter spongiae]|uniref:Bacteriophage tail tape measure C-terminal domain-containing protein n=1 Tax=Marilutibacter spongiae TaxID=2025720 RepID=A0A7W3TLC1_9GAMM|nr:hypothetical protein [Lysobacter spongiae]MBB1060431.1 hypothetical protein [Lysobacter spongiae]